MRKLRLEQPGKYTPTVGLSDPGPHILTPTDSGHTVSPHPDSLRATVLAYSHCLQMGRKTRTSYLVLPRAHSPSPCEPGDTENSKTRVDR